jgi:hypothetical protein
MRTARSDHEIVYQVQADHRLNLVPRVRRFLSAYVEADVAMRAEFRKVVAVATHRLVFDPLATATLEDDLAAAAAVSRRAGYIALADHSCKEVVDAGSNSLDLGLIRGAYATIAFVYRYVTGSYVGDPMLSGLAEAAVEFVLSTEAEYNPELWMGQNFSADLTRPVSNLEFQSEISEISPSVASQEVGNENKRDPISQPSTKDNLLLTA